MSNTPNNPFNPTPQNQGPQPNSSASHPTPATPTKQRPTNNPNDASLASIIDTIEAIIVALILALTFRAFIVEAFVIPTGSMAPTLLGAHFNIICPNCGYAFTRDASLQFQYNRANHTIQNFGQRGELTSSRAIPADTHFPQVCPNCQFVIPYEAYPQFLGSLIADDVRPPVAEHLVPFAWANNGDRILVLKYLYSVIEPHRFDVIVFKEPQQAHDNYIKRLIALPGETVEIINGDLFIAPPGKQNAADRLIARKPPFFQNDLWQLVYDNDCYPIDAGTPRADGAVWTTPWEGAGPTAQSWHTQGFILDYPNTAPGTIQFTVRDPYSLNVLGYNNDIPEAAVPGLRDGSFHYVGDLRLSATWTPANSDAVAFTLGQPHNQFRITWSNAGLQLDRYNPATGAFEKIETTPLAGPLPKHPYQLAMENVDRAIRFYIDGKLALEHETPWTAVDARAEATLFAHDPSAEIPAIRIDVGGPCALAHAKLSRDLYYTQNQPRDTNMQTANTGHPLTLNTDEFFALGDNSRRSSDGRFWNSVYPAIDDLGTRLGIVPRRYLLGKAFLVYWPAGFRITSNDKIPYLSNIPLVPNTGEIRLIR